MVYQKQPSSFSKLNRVRLMPLAGKDVCTKQPLQESQTPTTKPLFPQQQEGQLFPQQSTPPTKAMSQASWKSTWSVVAQTPLFKATVGLFFGAGLLFLAFYLVDLPATWKVLQMHVATPQGMLMVLLASLFFVLAFSFRAMRWKLFLNAVGQVSTFRCILLFLIGVFLNFLLPIRIGEVAKGLILRKLYGIHMSRSLPTIGMDKALDLLPALLVLAIVPILGIPMTMQIWIVLGLASSVLIVILLFVALSSWKRHVAIQLLHHLTSWIPGPLRGKVTFFVVELVDALIMSARRPKALVAAIGLTTMGVVFDGLYNMFAFFAIGYPMTFGKAIFGYMTFNMFYVLPNPPGQIGSNEIVGLLIFSGMLHMPASSVTAMMVLFHPWSGLLMCLMGLAALSALGLKLSTVTTLRPY